MRVAPVAPTKAASPVTMTATRGAYAALLGVALLAGPGHAAAQQQADQWAVTGTASAHTLVIGGPTTSFSAATLRTATWPGSASMNVAPLNTSSAFALRLQPKTSFELASDDLGRALAEALTPTARELADGFVMDGDEATKRISRGAERWLRHAPISLLSDDLAASARAMFLDRGVDVASADRLSLSDLGDAGGKLVTDRIDRLRRDEPVVFGALAAAALGGTIAVANNGGSEALERLGIKPGVSTSLFDGRVGLRVRAEFAAGFKDVELGGGVSWRFEHRGGKGQASFDVTPSGDRHFVLEMQATRDIDVAATIRRVDGDTRYGIGVRIHLK